MEEEVKIQGDIDISEALREFELKEKIEQMKKSPSQNKKNSEVPPMVRAVMKWSGGAIKEERQAEYVLLGFVIFAASVSLFLFFNADASKEKIAAPPGKKIVYPSDGPPRLESAF